MKNAIEKLHLKRLKEKNIVIEDIYKQNNGIAIRTSDGKEEDPVYKSPKIERNYYLGGKLIYRETEFDKKIEYSFNKTKETNEECSECGFQGKKSDFFDGCPYCGSQFNIEYSSTKGSTSGKAKELITIKNICILLLIYVVVSGILGIMPLIRNANWHTAISIFAGLIYVTIVFLPIYLLIKLFTTKDLPNDFIKIYGEEISNIHLLKDMQSALKNYYYNENSKYIDLIDYDILEYTNYQLILHNPNSVRINIQLKINEYYLNKNQIQKITCTKNITMLRNINYIEKNKKIHKCPNCGASTSAAESTCKYCKNKLPVNKLWLLEKIS